MCPKFLHVTIYITKSSRFQTYATFYQYLVIVVVELGVGTLINLHLRVKSSTTEDVVVREIISIPRKNAALPAVVRII